MKKRKWLNKDKLKIVFESGEVFDSGTGLFLEAGWQYQWDLGIGMNVGLRYQDMGDLTFTSSNVGISYSF